METTYPNYSKKQVYDAATKVFFKLATAAVKKRQDFTLETHFRDEGLINIVDQFKKFGYTTNMIYLTLDDIQLSSDRVEERVKKGGHDVNATDISGNYNEGLKFLDRFSNRFYNLAVYDTSEDIDTPEVLLHIERQKLKFLAHSPPPHIAKILSNIAEFFNGRGNHLGR